MSRFKEAVAKQQAELDAQEPDLVPIAIGDELFQVSVRRLPGPVWAGIVAKSPARSEQHFRVGYDTERAMELACRGHSVVTDSVGGVTPMDKVMDAAGVVQEDPWQDLFDSASGAELRALSAAWWGLNEKDPSEHLVALKKAFEGGA